MVLLFGCSAKFSQIFTPSLALKPSLLQQHAHDGTYHPLRRPRPWNAQPGAFKRRALPCLGANSPLSDGRHIRNRPLSVTFSVVQHAAGRGGHVERASAPCCGRQGGSGAFLSSLGRPAARIASLARTARRLRAWPRALRSPLSRRKNKLLFPEVQSGAHTRGCILPCSNAASARRTSTWSRRTCPASTRTPCRWR